MEDMFGKINRLLDLEKTRLERKLKSFLVRKQELLDKADACENAPRNVQRSSSEMDVATAMAMYKWLTAQGGRAESFPVAICHTDPSVLNSTNATPDPPLSLALPFTICAPAPIAPPGC